MLNSSFNPRLQLDVGPLLLCLTRRVAGCRLYEIQCKLICPGEQPLASLACLRHSVGAPARTSGSHPPLPFITAITARIWLKGSPRWGPHAIISSEFEWPQDFWPETADSLQSDLPLSPSHHCKSLARTSWHPLACSQPVLRPQLMPALALLYHGPAWAAQPKPARLLVTATATPGET